MFNDQTTGDIEYLPRSYLVFHSGLGIDGDPGVPTHRRLQYYYRHGCRARDEPWKQLILKGLYDDLVHQWPSSSGAEYALLYGTVSLATLLCGEELCVLVSVGPAGELWSMSGVCPFVSTTAGILSIYSKCGLRVWGSYSLVTNP